MSVEVNGVTYVLGTDTELSNVGDAWTLDLSLLAPPLADATYQVIAIATDALGNPTTDATSDELVIDTSGYRHTSGRFEGGNAWLVNIQRSDRLAVRDSNPAEGVEVVDRRYRPTGREGAPHSASPPRDLD